MLCYAAVPPRSPRLPHTAASEESPLRRGRYVQIVDAGRKLVACGLDGYVDGHVLTLLHSVRISPSPSVFDLRPIEPIQNVGTSQLLSPVAKRERPFAGERLGPRRALARMAGAPVAASRLDHLLGPERERRGRHPRRRHSYVRGGSIA